MDMISEQSSVISKLVNLVSNTGVVCYNNHMFIKTLVEFKLNRLNNTNGGDKIMEKLAIPIAERVFPAAKIYPASGSSYGGDGGFDGKIVFCDGEIGKLAASLRKDYAQKIEEEISRSPSTNKVIYITNQQITQKNEESLKQKYSHIQLTIISLDNLIKEIPEIPECLEILEIDKARDQLVLSYLSANNQFSKENTTLASYIPRFISENDSGDNNIRQSLFDYLCNPSQLTYIYAPAGHGKSCAIKHAINKALVSGEEDFIPPIYISPHSYTQNTLEAWVRTTIGTAYEHEIKDCLLCIDCLDEIPKSEIKNLIEGVRMWTNNQSFFRPIVFLGRTNQFDPSLLNELGKIKLLSLAAPTKQELTDYLKNSDIVISDRNLINRILEGRYSSNLFFVDKSIQYYKSKRTLPRTLISLLDYILKEELFTILRRQPSDDELKCIQKNAFEALNKKKPEIRLTDSLTISISDFSHRYIVEYLAARYLATRKIHDITKKTTRNGFVFPRLLNIVGLMLSILSESKENGKFSSVFRFFHNSRYNLDVLFSCESDYLSAETKKELISDCLDYFSESFNINRIEEHFNDLFFDEEIREENFRNLIERIQNEQSTFKTDALFHECFYLALYKPNLVPLFFVSFVKNTLFEAIADYKPVFLQQIKSMLFLLGIKSIAIVLSTNEINQLTQFALQVNDDEVLSNTCSIVNKNEASLSVDDFIRLFKCFFTSSERNQIMPAHTVPIQIDRSFNPSVSSLPFYFGFYELLKSQITKNPNCIELFLKTLHQEDIAIQKTVMNNSKNCEVIGECLIIANQTYPLSQDSIECLYYISLINEYDSQLIRILSNAEDKSIAARLFSLHIKKYNKERWYSYFTPFGFFLNHLMKNPVLYKKIINSIEVSQLEFEKMIDSYIGLADDSVFKLMRPETQESILEMREKTKDTQEREKMRKRLEIESVHEAFDPDLRHAAITEILSNVDFQKPLESLRELRFHQKSQNNKLSPFSLHVIYDLFETNPAFADKRIIEAWWNDNPDRKSAITAIDYIETNHFSFSVLNAQETDVINEWIRSTLTEHPFKGPKDKLLRMHVLLAKSIQNPEFKSIFGKTLHELSPLFKGFLLAPQTYSGTFSFDYLSEFYTQYEVLSFIKENINYITENGITLYSVGNYLASINTDSMDHNSRTIKKEIDEILYSFIVSHFSDDQAYINLSKYLDSLQISSTAIQKKLFLKSLVFDESKTRFNTNFSDFFIKINQARTEKESKYISDILKKKVKTCKSLIERKYITELIIVIDHRNWRAFKWYTNYLIERNDSKITESLSYSLMNNQIYCNSIHALKSAKKLWVYSDDGNTTFNSILRSMANDTFIAISKNSSNSYIMFSRVLKALSSIHKKTQSPNVINLEHRCIDNYLE